MKKVWSFCEIFVKKIWKKFEVFIVWGGHNCENSYLFINQSSWFYGPSFEFLKRAGLFKIEKIFKVSNSQSVLKNSDLDLKSVKKVWNNCEYSVK